MSTRSLRMSLPALIVAGCLVAACATISPSPSVTDATAPSPPPSGAPDELVIFAAASLNGVLAKVEPAYETSHPGVDLIVSTDSSTALRTQIEQGAPADVFLSADTKNPKTLADAGLTIGEPIPFARNHLAIITAIGGSPVITDPTQLADPGVKIIAAGEAVPITAYATQAIQAMGSLPGYPAGFADAYAANVVSREDNVGAIVAKIELGEGDAAIVYATDALAADRVFSIPIPVSANPTATYAGVVTSASTHPTEAAAFFDWLVGPDGQAILAGAGFLPPT